ncbi:MAG: AEC family transporter [Clostridiales bacterium]|nr:AEC family transporter [Clostridiales bacterium]
MEISILLIKQILSLVVMGLAGYGLRRSGMLNHEESRGLTVACLYVCVPCTMFQAFQTDITPEKLAGFLYAVTAVAVVHAVFFAFVWLAGRLYPMNGLEKASVIYSNSGNLIIPLVIGVFGSEYVFYTSAYLFVQNALLWSHGQRIMRKESKVSWKKIFFTPPIIAIFLGIVFMAMDWSLPEVIDTAFSGLASCIGPVSMLTIGILIAEMDLKKIFVNRRIYVMTAFRLLICPALTIVSVCLVWMLFPVKVDQVLCLIVLLGSCGPAATSVAQMAQMFDNDPGYASSINVLTTFGSIVTMPLMMMAAQLVLQWI